jgi:hypothetical protein
MTVDGHPVLGLLVDGEPHPNARGLLVELRRWCVPRPADPASDPAPAWLALSSRAPGLDAASASGSPLAAWVESAAEAEEAARLNPAILLTGSAALAERLGTGVLVVPAPAELDVAAIPVMPPFVRKRVRRRFGLPEEMVIDLRDSAPHALAGDGLSHTALAVTAAAIVPAGRLAEALAWGTPAVTDAESAAAMAASDGVEVRVGAPDDLARIAELLAADETQAALLSRAGRRLVEQGREPERLALEVARRLGLWPQPAPEWRGRVEAELVDLHTPAGSRLRERLDTIMTGVTADPSHGAAHVTSAPSRHLEEAPLMDLRAELARTDHALPEPYMPPAPRIGLRRRVRRLAGRVIRRRRTSRL